MIQVIITQNWSEFDELNRRRAEYLLANPDLMSYWNTVLYRQHQKLERGLYGIRIDERERGFLTESEIAGIVNVNELTGDIIYE